MKKSVFGLLALVGLLSACQNPSTSTTGNSSTTGSSQGSTTISTTTSSVSDSESSTTTGGDVPSVVTTEAKILNQLTADEVIWEGDYFATKENIFGGSAPTSEEGGVTGLVSADRYYRSYAKAGGQETTIDYYADPDTGILSTISLDPKTNELAYTHVSTATLSQAHPNPFHTLEVEDILVTNDTFTLEYTGEEIAQIMGELCPAEADTATLSGTIDANGQIVSVKVEGSSESTITKGTYRFEFALTTTEEAGIPAPLAPRPEDPALDELEAFFDKMAQGNYTVTTNVNITLPDYDIEQSQEATTRYTAEGILQEADGYEMGYAVVDEETLALVRATADGKLEGQDVPFSGTLLDYRSPFTMSPYMFDASNDGTTFTLATGLGLEEIAPALVNPDMLFIGNTWVADSGTVSYTLSGDAALFHMEVTETIEDMTAIYEFDCKVTNVGTTDLGYDLDTDYVPYKEPESWEDIDGAAELIEAYGYGTLPFCTVEGGQWAAFDASEGGPCLQLIAPSAEALNDVLNEYVQALIDDGWQMTTTGSTYADFVKTREDGYIMTLELQFGQTSDGTLILLINLFEPTEPAEPQTGWEDVDGLSEYLTGLGYPGTDLLPWFLPEGAQWNFDSSYESLDLYVAATDTTTTLDSVIAEFVEIGWVVDLRGQTDIGNGYMLSLCDLTYESEDGVKYSIQIQDYVSLGLGMYSLYFSAPNVPNELTEWMEENFRSSLNYTMDIEVNAILYENAELSGQPIGYSPMLTANIKVTEEAHWSSDSQGYNVLDVNESDGSLSRYQHDGTSFQLIQNLPGYDYTMANYTLLNAVEGNFTPVDGYYVLDTATANVFYNILGYSFSDQDTIYQSIAALDTENNTLTVELILNYGSEFATADATYYGYVMCPSPSVTSGRPKSTSMPSSARRLPPILSNRNFLPTQRGYPRIAPLFMRETNQRWVSLQTVSTWRVLGNMSTGTTSSRTYSGRRKERSRAKVTGSQET